MKNASLLLHISALGLGLGLGAAGCGKSDTPDVQPVLENYATNLHAMYAAAVTDEMDFSTKVEAFLAAPSDATLKTARDGWIASRANYMLTEGARFVDGPIDVDPPGHEAALNSWPLDEAYIDYTTSAMLIDDTSGIINNPAKLPTITIEGMDALNAQGGDENISNGYHAIEFLLWGQALSEVGPGTRPATDYIAGGPRPNVERRKAYLRTAITSVLSHLSAVRDAWAPGATYRTAFLAGGKDSVAKVLTGLGKMSKGELAGQRISAPYASKSRRDQHDCFSSLTLTDYVRDVKGILALYTGDYGANNGAGFDTLVAAADAEVNTKLLALLNTSIAAMSAIAPPFEAAIVGDDSNAGRTAIRAVVTSLRSQGNQLAGAAAALGLTIVVPEEN